MLVEDRDDLCHPHSDRREYEREHWPDVSVSYGSKLSCRIDYAKKKDKRAVIKSQKDESVRGDAVYKSHTVVVGSGEPPNSGGSTGK